MEPAQFPWQPWPEKGPAAPRPSVLPSGGLRALPAAEKGVRGPDISVLFGSLT